MKNKNFEISLPAEISYNNEDIIVTDPCYFIPDQIWDELISEWFVNGEETQYADKGVITFNNGAKVLYSSTAYGDGVYPVFVSRHSGTSVHNEETGVDAGMIAVVSIEDLKKIEDEFGFHNDKPFDINNQNYPRINDFSGSIEADGDGNFIGDLEVNTEGEVEEDEEDDYSYDDEDDDYNYEHEE